MSDFAPASVLPKFDQVVQGNVDIKQLSKKKYKITFSKIRKFLLYQVWSDSSQSLNDIRTVYYENAKKWIQQFNALNASLKDSDKPLFNPTTVMEIGKNKYLFVINQAKLNGKGCVVFKVSTKEIELSEKKMLKLPCGHYDGVRFDIDDSPLPASSIILLGNSLGLVSSWPLCFCVNSNTCPQGYPGAFGLSSQNAAGWTSWGYSSTNWSIKDIDNIGTNGYLFVYMNSWLCGTNINDDQGPAQLVTVSGASQINALNNPTLNNPNPSIGGSLSLSILDYLKQQGYPPGQGPQQSLLPNLIFDEEIYYITPTSLYFTNPNPPNPPTAFQYSSLPPTPDGTSKCIYISVLTSSELGLLNGLSPKFPNPNIPLTNLLTNLSVTNIINNDGSSTNATLVTNNPNPNGPYIIFPGGGKSGFFTFNASIPFYQNNNQYNISYLPTNLSVTIYLNI